MSIFDHEMMARALQLAERGLYSSSPNPRVGCVLTQNQHIISEGFHLKAGAAHAEVAALQATRENTAGACAYVTLEPCAHQGKTGPCAEALVNAGISRVVYGMEDPNPLVAGKGLSLLRDAGVDIVGPLMEDSARALNPGFIKRMTQGLPFVRCKLAMSLDGRTAMADGKSQWITGPAARADVQHLRARSCAIITGVETVIHDNPLLNVRLPNVVRQAQRIIMDSQLRTPPQSEIFSVGEKVIIAHTRQAQVHPEACIANAEYWQCEERNKRIDLRAFLTRLAKEKHINEVMVEAGATLNGAFLSAGLVDEIVIYMAAKLMGRDARPLFDLSINTMAAQLSLNIRDVRAVGDDWRITAEPDVES